MFGVRHNLADMEKYYPPMAEKPIEKGLIMFYGHSFFTRWSETWNHRPLEEDIRKKDGSVAAVNHGFGSSVSADLLYNYPRMVKPWEPKVLVLITFNNDHSKGYSATEIVNNLAYLCDFATYDFPDIQIYCLNAAPCPRRNGMRDHVWAMRNEYDALLKAFCGTRKNCTYVDQKQWPMFYENPADIGNEDKIRCDIYGEDQIHFNQAGYDLYAEEFRKLLDKHL